MSHFLGSWWLRGPALALACMGVLMALMTSAFATDNLDSRHWHDLTNITWNYNLGDWTDVYWSTAVTYAQDDWSNSTAIDLNKVTGTSQIDISRGLAINGPCNDTETMACAEIVSWNPFTGHLYDTNIWFNNDRDWAAGVCPSNSGRTRQTAALHELGHAAGVLDESNDLNAVMWQVLPETCRLLTSHDTGSMNANYTGH